MLYIGSHVSFNKDTQLIGVVQTAIENDANVFMFYTGSNQSTLRFPIDKNLTDKAHQIMLEHNIDREKCIIHAPFIINLANNSDERKYQFYIDFLKQEIDRCIALGINNLVLHPGSHVKVAKEEALLSVSNGLNEALKENQNIKILIEFMSGKGTEVGSTIDELKTILENVIYKDKVYICLDTCHINDAGYDLNNFDEFLNEFDQKIGIDKIKCIHINDSKNNLGTHKDRHENIGYGTIGFQTLINIIYNKRLEDVPKILETPFINDQSPYKTEIKIIREKKFIEFKWTFYIYHKTLTTLNKPHHLIYFYNPPNKQ